MVRTAQGKRYSRPATIVPAPDDELVLFAVFLRYDSQPNRVRQVIVWRVRPMTLVEEIGALDR